MKIYLWNKGKWELYEGTKTELKDELEKRNINIGHSANIGDYAEIGHYAEIGDSAEIGDFARIGNSARIGDFANIGDSAEIGDFARIGNSARIGDSAEIGYSARIGDSANIGDSAEIGYSARIGDFANIEDKYNAGGKDTFSELNILINTGVLMQQGVGTFYKCVKPDLTDFYSGKHPYKVGGEHRINSLVPDQTSACALSLGQGFHFGSYWHAVKFLNKREGMIISATINIKDILAVHDKIRVCAYSDIKIVNLGGGNAQKTKEA